MAVKDKAAGNDRAASLKSLLRLKRPSPLRSSVLAGRKVVCQRSPRAQANIEGPAENT
jgi:hypothetical protein